MRGPRALRADGRALLLPPPLALLAAAAAFALAACAPSPIEGLPFVDGKGLRLELRQAGRFPRGEEGLFGVSRPANRYLVDPPPTLAAEANLELELSLESAAGLRLVLSLSSRADGGEPFHEASLPLASGKLRASFPLPGGARLASLGLSFRAEGQAPLPADFRAELGSLALVARYAGVGRSPEGARLSPGSSLLRSGGVEKASLVWPFAPASTSAVAREGVAALILDYGPLQPSARIRISLPGRPPLVFRGRTGGGTMVLPERLFPAASLAGPVAAEAPSILSFRATRLPPEEAEVVDLALALDAPPPPGDADYALWRWELLPSVLFLDFRDYATQDRYLKRLAFFVEKKGWKGKLAKDEDIAALHGWNAHDYRSEDLAAFFSAAAAEAFPLGREELVLRGLLEERGIIVRGGRAWGAGRGALVSVSRESAPWLRATFTTHEASHAVFFADADYRRFAEGLWAAMPGEEKWFWRLYFGWMNYDTGNDYLMANELQAYLFQQPVAKAEEYFTKILPARLLENHPELGPRLEAWMAAWGGSFAARAAAVEARLAASHGLRAGVAWFLER